MAPRRSGAKRGWAVSAIALGAGAGGVVSAWILRHVLPIEPLLVIGAFLLGFGTLWTFVNALQPAPEPTSVVPAHVAFLGRPTAASNAPPLPAPLPALAVEPHANPHMQRLDDQIRELTRQINKAGVRLATGKLSEEGYRQLVEGLKRERGRLEAQRVEHELKN